MRDKRFVAVHRGGTLSKEQHAQLIKWACNCVEHILPLLGESMDARLNHVLTIAKAWEKGEATVGDARNASLQAIAIANGVSNPVAITVARAVGHAVATAHMADHSWISADYALKAMKIFGKSIEIEQEWQNEQLPSEVKELVISARNKKVKY